MNRLVPSTCGHCGKKGLDPRNVNDLKAHLHGGKVEFVSEGSVAGHVELIGPAERPDERLERLRAGKKITLQEP